MGRRRNKSVGRYALIGGAASTGLVASGAAILWHRLARRPLPQVKGTIEIPELNGKVSVRRDRWGVPHVEAGSRDDLYFAQGYCHGQDRLFQMDFYRRVVAGRVAEIAGEEGLPIDRLMRTLGIRRIAEREEAELAPELRARLERFCAGVNAAARDARAMPFEMQVLRQGSFAPWQPVDILGLGKLLAFGLSTNWERELLRSDMVRELGPELAARLDPVYPADNPVVDQTPFSGEGLPLVEQIDAVRRSIGLAAEASGSNNWAVSGARSATGSPLVAGDPHLPPSMPGIWYEVELREGERFVRGASLPGMPGVYMGQNNDVCWTFTNVMADVQDLFVERIEGERYLFEDEWRPLETRLEEIVVKGAAEPVVLEVRSTHHGPIVNEALGADEGEPLALAWQTLAEPTAFEGMFELLEISSGRELVAKLEGHTSPASNLIWGDRGGSIGYKLIGRLPMRRGGSPDLPKPGWSGEFEWDGTVPYDELPEEVDPESGFLITANNRIVGDEYPHHITSEWLDGFRAKRIEQLLEETEKHDLESFEAIQGDNLSLPGIEAAARLSRLHPSGQRERSAIERLRSWDGCLGPGDDRRHDLPGLPAAIGARSRPRRDRRPRPLRALARPRRQRLHPAHHLSLALALAPDEPLGGSRRGADRPALGRARTGGAGRRSRRPRRALRPRSRGLALGAGPRDEVPAPAGRRQPPLRPAAQPSPPRRRRPGDRQPDRLRPQRSLQRRLGAELADDRRPGRPRPLPLAGLYRPVRPPRQPPLRRPPGRLARGPDAADARRGPLVGFGAGPKRDLGAGFGFPQGCRGARSHSYFFLPPSS